jgi:hypothetical protein
LQWVKQVISQNIFAFIWTYYIRHNSLKIPSQFSRIYTLFPTHKWCYILTVFTSWSSLSHNRRYKFSLESALSKRRSLVWSWSPLGFEPDRLCAAGTRRGDLGGSGGGVGCWEASCKGLGRGGNVGGGLRSNTCWCRSENRYNHNLGL